MKKTELALLLTNIAGFLGIASLIVTGHSGFASKFANFFFFGLVIETLIYIIKS